MSVPQWNADIITQEVEAEAEIQANGGLEKDAQGALGVKVDGSSVTINNEGELEASVGTVDQTYDPTSTNAQSGTAVAEALATLPKFNMFKCKYAPGTAPTMDNMTPSAAWRDAESSENIWYVAFFNKGSHLFYNDTGLVEVLDATIQLPITNTMSMFSSCTSLNSVHLFDLSSATDTTSMFAFCTSLTSVPLFDLSSATDTAEMFVGCTSVETGALALYQQVSTQTTPPSNHSDMFTDCGSGTTTGAAELAQIPTSWGGTMA